MIDAADGAATAAPDGDPPARTRRRQPEVHRALILEAARICFADKGYAGTTIREVAARAGVTHGLVMRNFRSKEQLFAAAVPGPRVALARDIAGDLDGLPGRVARSFVERMEAQDGSDPFVALIRSAASDVDAARVLLTAMRDQSLPAYRTVLDAPDTATRVDLLGAHLIGVTFSRYVLRDGPLAELTADTLVGHLTASIRGILFAPRHGS